MSHSYGPEHASGNGMVNVMIELFFVSCLSEDPARCQNRSLIFVETNLMACMVHGQQVMAEWIESHPRETVQEWQCRTVDRRKAEI
ncbi:hypothetical protein [Paracoccus sp. SY]|uniref:hypothetical protein n=1 Tax=Paracoccus sp. SY TaxID=1330255 RepID=UPI001EFE0B5C|nr:hypothetical protein [Paracoccus sp. SY]